MINEKQESLKVKRGQSFLTMGELGKNNQGWLYLVGAIFIFISWQVAGALFLAPILIYGVVSGTVDTVATSYPLAWLVSALLTFSMIWVAAFVVLRWWHQRPFLTLFTQAPQLRWGRIIESGLVYGVLVLGASLVEAWWINPGIYEWSYDPRWFWLFAGGILLLVPMQATAEEILFRGYLLQGTALLTRNIWVLSLLNGVLFMFPHLLNEEVQADPILVPLGFVVSGFFFAYITIMDNGMELAIGAHTANNIFALLFTNLANSSLKTAPLFIVKELDAVYSLVSLVVIAVLFTAWFARRRESHHQERDIHQP